MATVIVKPTKDPSQRFIPREHGATAMLLTPFFAAVILMRRLYWPELVALVAIVCAFAIKDPLVVMARQRFVWKQEHPETKSARVSALVEALVLAVCGITLMVVRDWRSFVPLFLGAGAFTILAVTLNVWNKQRSEWFQVTSAAALSATSIAACLSAEGVIPEWCWLLWFLCALQAAAGIFVVHARLDALIAARKGRAVSRENRRAAFVCQAAMLAAAAFFAVEGRPWNAAALFIAAVSYLAELRRQRDATSLQMPLKRVGLEALALSTVYAVLNIFSFWHA